jgi:ribosomal protein S12 methylthiotransferase accessory factor YcaO
MTVATADHGWQCRPAPKYAPYGVVRAVPPGETIRRVSPLLARIGVTRVAEVTGLDRAGIPNFIAARPRERGEGISYYNGKGLTRAAAKAGALMEAIERYSGESCDLTTHYYDRAELERRRPTVDPAELIAPPCTEYRPGLRLEWVEGFDLLNRRSTYLPLNAVVCPYDPPPGRPTLYYSTTNGLASGNTLEEAVCHALCEVIERDATALCGASRDLAPAVAQVLGSMAMDAPEAEALVPAHRFPLIDLASLPEPAQVLVDKLRRARLLVYLRDATSTAGIPTLDCAIVDPRSDGCHFVHGGSGTHPDARVAATRALTEAAQSRVGHIQGGREDLPSIVRTPVAFEPDEVYGTGELRPFSSIRSYVHARIDEDIACLLDGLERDGFPQVVAVDLTRPEVGVPVVRIVIPRAEAWNIFFIHARRAVFGRRVRHILREAVHGSEGEQ